MKKFTKIKELSDSRRMPRLDKIRLGAKLIKVTGTGNNQKEVLYPVELPFFLLPDEVAAVHGMGDTASARAAAMGVTRKDVLDFIAENGHRLAEELPVMIPVEDESYSFPQSYKLYGSGAGLKCIGDGETAQERVGNKNEWVDKKCPCNQLKTEDNPKGGCTIAAHLSVILPDVAMGGVYQIDTGSINSIIDINSGIEMVRSMIGRVAMIPLKLRRIATETHHDGKRQTHYTCQLTIEGNIQAIAAMKADERLISHQDVLLLDEPDYTREERPADGQYTQPERITRIIEEMKTLAKSGKMKESERESMRSALDENNDTAIEAIYNAVKSRLSGKTADDLADTLEQGK